MRKSPLSALLLTFVIGLVWSFQATSAVRADEPDAILPHLRTLKMVASTVPVNGDVNPYGVALVRHTVGRLQRGHILVSNFNNSNNLQGTGTTIVDVAPDGSVSLFAQISAATLPGSCPGGVGLTTALVALKAGWVIVGSLPTTDGTSATAQAGCLIVLNSMGIPVTTFSDPLINGPWDMTAREHGSAAALFFTNVLNGTVAANGQVVNMGTVVRLDLALDKHGMPAAKSLTVIASGLSERTDPAALVVGPTGLGLGSSHGCERGDGHGCSDDNADDEQPVLYVADTVNNRIAVVGHPLTRSDSAGPGITLSIGGRLNGPLGLAVARNGHVLTVNSGDGFIVETSAGGMQVARKQLDNTGSPPGAGALFGLLTISGKRAYFVDDATNTLELLY